MEMIQFMGRHTAQGTGLLTTMSLTTLLLASGSPRRKELLSVIGVPFEVMPADTDETPFPGEQPAAYVSRLAARKALFVVEKHPGSCVLGADTTVADNGILLGKPQSRLQAFEMLKQLGGRVHQVYTALALWDVHQKQLVSVLCKTPVPMRAYTDMEINDYVSSGDPMDKAGAYAIQNTRFHPAENFRGCFANVMGLPICHLTRILTQLGIPLQADVPAACQQYLAYQCQVYPAVLRGEDAG
jgi:septum formation protein